MYYIRKVERTKWDGLALHDSVSIGDISTDDNDISVWEDDNSKDEYKKLSLAFALTTGKICDLYCIRIPEQALKNKKLEMEYKASGTPYFTKQTKHVNIKVPTLYELGDLAEIMYDEVESQKMEYISEQELKELFYYAIKADEIKIDFNDKRYRNFRKSLADIENQKGAIDFSILTNAKDVMPDNRVKCPTCYGQGKISKERYLQIKVR